MADEARRDQSVEALRALMAAVGQCRLYPAAHPIAAQSIADLARHLTTLLAQEPEWHLAVVGGRCVAGGLTLDERPGTYGPLLQDLKARGVDRLVFRRGLEPGELASFVVLLATAPRRAEGASLGAQLIEMGIRSIAAERLSLQDGRAAARESVLLDEAGSEFSEIYNQAVGFLEETVAQAREGRKIRVWEAEAFVQSIISQMHQDRSPYLILMTLKTHHDYTFTHIINVCLLTLMQFEALGVSPQLLRECGLASMLHDIGKCLVPREILSKPGRLTPEELAIIQRHPQDGVHILRRTPAIPDLAVVVAFEHHMRFNNAGYPRIRRPRALHPCSLMTNLADTYDAMRSRRSYQPGHPPEKVAAVIGKHAGIDFDPDLAQAFLRIMGAYPPGTFVRLDSGEEGLVVQVNPTDPYRPRVRLLRDGRGATLRSGEIIDLTRKETIGGHFTRTILESIVAPPAGHSGGSQ